MWRPTVLVLIGGCLSLAGALISVPAADNPILLENEQVRVRRVILEPGVQYPDHTHSLPHVGVIVRGGTLEFREGSKVETVTFQSGDAGWREANVTHRIKNLSSEPVHVVEVELKSR